jgi:hypothetical protein
LQVENEELKEHHQDIKSKNKVLFEQITQSKHDESTTNEISQIQQSQMSEPASDEGNIGEIHSLY